MRHHTAAIILSLTFVGGAFAQTPPQVIPFHGVAQDVNGSPVTGPLAVTLAIYEDPAGGVPLWVEVHPVTADAEGLFSVLLGLNSPAGSLVNLFTTGAPLWVGVQVEGQAEQPRSLLASVPYAIKAADANTLGGLPVSAFALAGGAPVALAASGGDTASPTPSADVDGGVGLEAASGELTESSDDVVQPDDYIIQNSLCVGTDCVNGEDFNFDTIRLKENNLRIKFEDTSSTGSFPSNDWQIRINDSRDGGKNTFSVEDVTGGRIPFLIEAPAPTNALYVEDTGDIGLNTNAPVVELHMVDGNTPTVRLQQDGSSGFTAQTFDVAANEANFFIRDATNGSNLPFRLRPGAPTSSIDIAASGNVGFGTSSPQKDLHLMGDMRIQGAAGGWDLAGDSSNGALKFVWTPTDAETVRITSTGVGIGTTNPQKPLQVTGGGIRIERTDGGVNWDIGPDGTNDFKILRNSSEIARLNSTGLGVFTTNPQRPLHTVGGAIRIERGFGGSYWDIGPDGTNDFKVLYNGVTEVARFTASGSVGVGTANPATEMEVNGTITVSGLVNTSDRRWKRNIRTLDHAVEAVTRLRGVRFDWRQDEFPQKRFSRSSQIGLIAQEVEEVVPELVETGPDGFKSVAYSNVVAILIEAVKEQQVEIERLRARLDALDPAGIQTTTAP